MPQGEFTTEVGRLINTQYGLTLNDVDESQIQTAWESNDTPQEFVDWFGDKYDLVRLDGRIM
jgi:hypothetical protein